MAVRTRRVTAPLLVPTAAANLYTVPTGRTLVVRSLWFTNMVAAAVVYEFGIGGVGAGQALQSNGQATSKGAFEVRVSGTLVLNSGDQLWAKCNTLNALYMTVFGSLLLGAPS